MTTLLNATPRRLPARWPWLALAILVPLALAFVLVKQASWRPVTIPCESNSPPQHLLVAYAPDGHYVAIASAHRLRLWDVWHSRFAGELAVEDANQIALAFAADCQSVLAIYSDKQVGALIVWNVTTNQDQKIPLHFRTEMDESPWPVGLYPCTDAAQHKRLIRTAFRPVGDFSIGAEDEHQQWRVLLCDAPSGRMLKMLTLKGADVPTNCVLSPDGQKLAFRGAFPDAMHPATSHPGIVVMDTQNGQLKAVLPIKTAATANNDDTAPLTFSPDSQLLANGRTSGAVEVWSLQSLKLLYTLKAHAAPITSLAFASDGKLLASGSQDKTIKLWSLPGGKLLRTLKSHIAGIYALAFSPDSTSLASGSADGMVKLWRVR